VDMPYLPVTVTVAHVKFL